ncbi:MFS transporter [Aureisphaera galaxeae]|uniref:MFS transporter n=1 Tax=Aureisphaera galaxeae TaxID=1538023 RepID=UPI00235096AF|nr:MFS transporter [Aureisphaera galaxeae]MDC8006074.1 MFS transporter [Aureisphaera galaxeae]
MEEKIKPIKIIHIALCVGAAFAYYFFGDLQTLDFLKIPKVDASSVPFLLMPLAAVLLGNLLYKQQLKNSDPTMSLEEKFPVYQSASIVRWALLDGAAFFLLFVKREFILVGLLLIFYMAFLKPSVESMKRDFKAVGN